MALGRQAERQSELMMTWGEMPRSPGHMFNDRLQAVLIEGNRPVWAAFCYEAGSAKMRR